MTENNELTEAELQAVAGGILPVLGYTLWTLGYVGALQVAADFGAGLGRGFYDFTHNTP